MISVTFEGESFSAVLASLSIALAALLEETATEFHFLKPAGKCRVVEIEFTSHAVMGLTPSVEQEISIFQRCFEACLSKGSSHLDAVRNSKIKINGVEYRPAVEPHKPLQNPASSTLIAGSKGRDQYLSSTPTDHDRLHDENHLRIVHPTGFNWDKSVLTSNAGTIQLPVAYKRLAEKHLPEVQTRLVPSKGNSLRQLLTEQGSEKLSRFFKLLGTQDLRDDQRKLNF